MTGLRSGCMARGSGCKGERLGCGHSASYQLHYYRCERQTLVFQLPACVLLGEPQIINTQIDIVREVGRSRESGPGRLR